MDATGLHALLELRRTAHGKEGYFDTFGNPYSSVYYLGSVRASSRIWRGQRDRHIDDALNQARRILGLVLDTTDPHRAPEVARDRHPSDIPG